MSSITINPGGELALPEDLCERYGMKPGSPIRVIETRSGILLVPLTNAPMAAELTRELGEWQELSAASWDMFPYQDQPA